MGTTTEKKWSSIGTDVDPALSRTSSRTTRARHRRSVGPLKLAAASMLASAGLMAAPFGDTPRAEAGVCIGGLSWTVGLQLATLSTNMDTVRGKGYVDFLNSPACGIDFRVYIQANVCGFWGCNWNSLGSQGGSPSSDPYWRHRWEACYGGETLQYRSKAQWTFQKAGSSSPSNYFYDGAARSLHCK